MILIPALIFMNIGFLLVADLVHQHITQQTIWANYQQSWKLRRCLEDRLLHELNGTELKDNTVSLIGEKFISDPQPTDGSNGIQLQQLILRDAHNTNYKLYILIQRRVENFKVQTTNPKIIGWHFGA